MEFHEAANLFPMMIGDDYLSLRDDIKANGLLEPIVTYEGKILDGRNRYTACLDLGIEPRYEAYEGDAVAYVISKNLHRRHLTTSQRAMIAATVANLPKHLHADRSNDLSVSQSDAATLLSVSVPSVKRAETVVSQGVFELQEMVRQGELSVSKAAEVAKEPEEAQQEFVSQQKNPVLYSSKSDEWYTPDAIITRTVQVLKTIDLDPCSNSHEHPTIPAKDHYTESDDGLSQFWYGKVYMNPPYGRELAGWVERLVAEYDSKNVTEAIALVPSRTDTKWFRQFACYPRCFIWGRLSFSEHGTAPFPSMVVYLGNNEAGFKAAFGDIGDVYRRI